MDRVHDVEEVARTRLRALRHGQHLSLEELSRRSNVSASTISRIETGKRSISLDVLVPLAAALRIDLGDHDARGAGRSLG